MHINEKNKLNDLGDWLRIQHKNPSTAELKIKTCVWFHYTKEPADQNLNSTSIPNDG